MGMSVLVRHSSSLLSQSLWYVLPSFPHRGLYVPSHCMGSQEHWNSPFSSKHLALNLQSLGQLPGDQIHTYTCVNNVKNGGNRLGANQHWLQASLFLPRSIRHRILTYSGGFELITVSDYLINYLIPFRLIWGVFFPTQSCVKLSQTGHGGV